MQDVWGTDRRAIKQITYLIGNGRRSEFSLELSTGKLCMHRRVLSLGNLPQHAIIPTSLQDSRAPALCLPSASLTKQRNKRDKGKGAGSLLSGRDVVMLAVSQSAGLWLSGMIGQADRKSCTVVMVEASNPGHAQVRRLLVLGNRALHEKQKAAVTTATLPGTGFLPPAPTPPYPHTATCAHTHSPFDFPGPASHRHTHL